jgi:hypothetical protein
MEAAPRAIVAAGVGNAPENATYINTMLDTHPNMKHFLVHFYTCLLSQGGHLQFPELLAGRRYWEECVADDTNHTFRRLVSVLFPEKTEVGTVMEAVLGFHTDLSGSHRLQWHEVLAMLDDDGETDERLLVERINHIIADSITRIHTELGKFYDMDTPEWELVLTVLPEHMTGVAVSSSNQDWEGRYTHAVNTRGLYAPPPSLVYLGHHGLSDHDRIDFFRAVAGDASARRDSRATQLAIKDNEPEDAYSSEALERQKTLNNVQDPTRLQ